MKKLFISFILICFFVSNAYAVVVGYSRTFGGGDIVYFVNQNNETPTTGWDNGESWTALGSYVFPAEATEALYETQSLRIGNEGDVGNAIAYTDFTAKTEVFGFTRYRCKDNIVASSSYIILLLDSVQADLFKIYQNTDGRMAIRTGGTFTSYSATTLVADTEYGLFFHFKTGTGSNAEGELWIVTIPTAGTPIVRPASSELSTSAANSTTSATRYQLEAISDANSSEQFDQTLLSITEFTSVQND